MHARQALTYYVHHLPNGKTYLSYEPSCQRIEAESFSEAQRKITQRPEQKCGKCQCVPVAELAM